MGFLSAFSCSNERETSTRKRRNGARLYVIVVMALGTKLFARANVAVFSQRSSDWRRQRRQAVLVSQWLSRAFESAMWRWRPPDVRTVCANVATNTSLVLPGRFGVSFSMAILGWR